MVVACKGHSDPKTWIIADYVVLSLTRITEPDVSRSESQQNHQYDFHAAHPLQFEGCELRDWTSSIVLVSKVANFFIST